MIPNEGFLTLHDVVKKAQARLSKGAWDYLVGGSDTETTLIRNRLAIDSLAFRPRVLRDVSAMDCSVTLLGRRIRLPVVLAPIGSLETFESGGGATAAKAAAVADVPVMISSRSAPGLEESAAAASESYRIYQLYVRGDSGFVDDAVARAVDAGYHAFCITVDSAHYSRRERDLANGFAKPWRQGAKGIEFQAAFNWNDVRCFKEKHGMPLILKGIGTAEDAAEAVQLGVDAVYVSNHGGRQLDHCLGSLEVLPEIVEAVGGRAEIVVDGGFLRGTDVVKALALGANAVGLGKLLAFALAAGGERALVATLVLLEEEITTTLGLLGARTVAELRPEMLCRAQPVIAAGVVSAFPLLAQGY